MRSTLIELGPWPAWLTVVAALLGAAVFLYVDLRDRRATGRDEPSSTGRLIIVALIGAALAVAACLAVNHWGPVKVRSWGTALMIGFAAGWAWAVHLARAKGGIGVENLTDITIAILVGALIGARLVAASLNWPEFAQHPGELLRIWEGGLSFHGGLIGGWLGGTALAVRRGLGYARIVDFIPSVALGYAITRVGCFMNACCYGIPTDGPLGVCFRELPGNDGLVPRHPTQLYAAAINLAIFVILVKVTPYLRCRWHVAMLYLPLYAIYRFGIEYLRHGATAHASHMIPSLTQAQVASVFMFVFGTGWLLVDWIITRPRADAMGTDDDE